MSEKKQLNRPYEAPNGRCCAFGKDEKTMVPISAEDRFGRETLRRCEYPKKDCATECPIGRELARRQAQMYSQPDPTTRSGLSFRP